MNIHLYANGSSGNHGCEALTRSFIVLLQNSSNNTISVFSRNPNEDKKYGISEISNLQEIAHEPISRWSWKNVLYHIKKMRFHADYVYYLLFYKSFGKQITQGDIYLSIGGDNYCYKASYWLYALNQIIIKNKGLTVLAGCSLEPQEIEGELEADLKTFKLIIARESLTYQSLVNKEFLNVKLCPDPAFILPTANVTMPDGCISGNTVGINMSPVIIDREQSPGMVTQCYKALIQHILDITDMTIALIPHVVQQGNDDRIAMKHLYEVFKSSGRIFLIPDANCETIKGYIAQCRYIIAARTHASIAAYSLGIPTLVVGYSVKARGIALDLFGTEENFVLPVQQLSHTQSLCHAFDWLHQQEEHIKQHYEKHLQTYINQVYQLPQFIKEITRDHENG